MSEANECPRCGHDIFIKLGVGEYRCTECKLDLYASDWHLQKLQTENANLKKIIAKELSENDEFGSEFVIVSILKEREQKLLEVIDMMKTTLSFYSRKDADQITDVCIWQGEGYAAGWSVVDQGDKANEALAKVEEMMKEIGK